MRCINSMPEIVVAAPLNRLKPSMTFVRDLMFRWSCSIKLFRYFEDLTSVSAGSKPSAFISRTARCTGSIAIECDGFRWLPLMLDGLLEKCFCCCHVVFGAQQEVYRLAGPIHRTIEVDPLAADLQVRFVDTPRLSRGRAKTAPTFDEFGRITL